MHRVTQGSRAPIGLVCIKNYSLRIYLDTGTCRHGIDGHGEDWTEYTGEGAAHRHKEIYCAERG